MNKKFLHLSLSFFMISLGLLLLSIAIYKPVKASTSITETWTIDEYRTLVIDTDLSDRPRLQSYVSIGPAIWRVMGDVGGTGYTEHYKASGWVEEIDGKLKQTIHPGGGYCIFTEDMSPTPNPTTCAEYFINTPNKGHVTRAEYPGGPFLAKLSVRGLYGFVVPSADNNWIDGAGTSYPTVWSIEGTLGEP